MSKFIFTVYKTTNLINNRIYIGVHKTRNPNDRYLGSGNLIKSAIEKYGRENFQKEVLFLFSEAENAYLKEAELVDAAFLSQKETYNLRVGGTNSNKNKHAQVGSENPHYGTVWVHLEDQAKKIQASELDFFKATGWTKGRGAFFSVRLSKGNSTRTWNTPRGTQNPHTGKVWVNKNGSRKRVCLSESLELESKGWILGMSPPKLKVEPKPIVGEHNPQAKLTWDQVNEMRNIAPGKSLRELSERFGVSRMAVSKILRHQTWITTLGVGG